MLSKINQKNVRKRDSLLISTTHFLAGECFFCEYMEDRETGLSKIKETVENVFNFFRVYCIFRKQLRAGARVADKGFFYLPKVHSYQDLPWRVP